MGASEISIGGRPVSRIVVGGEVVWEKRKRYAYYFNGVDSNCLLDTQYVIAGAWYDAAPVYTPYVRFNSFVIDYEHMTQTKPTYQCRFMSNVIYDSKVAFVIAYNRNKTVTNQDIPVKYGRQTLDLSADGSEFSVALDGQVLGRHADSFTRTISIGGIGAGNAPHNYYWWWRGYIYGVSLDNGEWLNIEDLPGAHLVNVTRYELDRNGEIIESTATIINT